MTTLEHARELLGHSDAPEVLQIIDEVIAKARDAGVAVALANAGTGQDIAQCIARGVRLLLVGMDRQFIARMGLQMLTQTRDYLSGSTLPV